MKISEIQTGLKKSHGQGYVTTAEELVDMERLPTGIYPIDYTTGGGFPRGRVSILWGAESSGKTNIALKALAMNQILEPNKIQVFLDLEGSFDKKWAKALGVDCSKNKLAVIQPHYAEQAVNIIQGIVAAEDAGCIVLDSIGAMITINEEESDASKMQVGGAALVITKMVKKLTVGLSKALSEERYPTIIIINQMRNKIGVMYGSPDDMPGGKALKHSSSLTLKVRGKDEVDASINKDRPSYKFIAGSVFKTKVQTLANNFEFKFPIVNQGGLKIGHVPDWNTLVSQMKDLGWMGKEGKKVICLGQEYATYKAAEQDIYSQPDVLFAIKKQIMEARLQEIYGDDYD
jgi:recombination protein RecA